MDNRLIQSIVARGNTLGWGHVRGLHYEELLRARRAAGAHVNAVLRREPGPGEPCGLYLAARAAAVRAHDAACLAIQDARARDLDAECLRTRWADVPSTGVYVVTDQGEYRIGSECARKLGFEVNAEPGAS
jgi:hypothetical protein